MSPFNRIEAIMWCFQVLFLWVGLFANNYRSAFALGTRVGEWFCISEVLWFVYPFAFHSEIYFRPPSSSSFDWILCQPTSVIAGLTAATPNRFWKILFLDFIALWVLNSESRSPFGLGKVIKEKRKNRELAEHLENK